MHGCEPSPEELCCLGDSVEDLRDEVEYSMRDNALCAEEPSKSEFPRFIDARPIEDDVSDKQAKL